MWYVELYMQISEGFILNLEGTKYDKFEVDQDPKLYIECYLASTLTLKEFRYVQRKIMVCKWRSLDNIRKVILLYWGINTIEV